MWHFFGQNIKNQTISINYGTIGAVKRPHNLNRLEINQLWANYAVIGLSDFFSKLYIYIIVYTLHTLYTLYYIYILLLLYKPINL